MSRGRVAVIVGAVLVVAGGVLLWWWNQPLRRFDRAMAECREATEVHGERIKDMEAAAAIGNDAEYFNRVSAQAREARKRAEAACAKADAISRDW